MNRNTLSRRSVTFLISLVLVTCAPAMSQNADSLGGAFKSPAGTSTTFYGEQYVVRSNGTFEYKFVGRANNHTVRETDSGTIILSGVYVTFKFAGRTTR